MIIATKDVAVGQPSKRFIGIFSLAMINCAAVLNLKNFPVMAEYGLGMLFFYAFSVFFFLIPTALVSAELATGFPGEGGIFHWVSKALGDRLGFLAIWLQFVSNAVGFPVTLIYLAALLAYVSGYPELAARSDYVFLVVLVVTWLGTGITLRGMRLTSFVTHWASLLGMIIPGLIVIFLGISWILCGHDSYTALSLEALFPRLNSVEQFIFLLNVFLGFSGLEVSAAHIQEVKNPRRSYPWALLLAAVMIFAISLLGSLAIAFSVPKEVLKLESGVLQAMEALLTQFDLGVLTPWIALAMALGALGHFVAWVAGPARGLLATAKCGYLPPFLRKTNAWGMPSAIMVSQACAITFFSLFLLWLPSITTCFWVLMAMTAQTLLVMYILLFITGIVLKFKYPQVKRAYTVPFGKWGMTAIGSLATLACIGAYIIGFLPPKEIHFENRMLYVLIMLLGNAFLMLPAWVIIRSRKFHEKSAPKQVEFLGMEK
ncbi:MAG: APC family permease [Puniceicoccales bacterium]|jgi:amino acid transporter|nr:APC family permease [Puniceicoccales bacterium]